MRPLSFLAVLVLAAAPALSDTGTGTAAFNFLKIGLGARALGMGGAYTAAADDATSIYWNPAGLAGMEGAEALVGYVAWVTGINSPFAAYSRPLGPVSRLAVSVNSFYVGGMTKTDENDIELGEFSSSILIPTLAYARKMSDRLCIGASAKFVYQSIDEYTSLGSALDLGATYRPLDKPYSFGLVVQNLGSQLTAFVEEKDLTPVTAKVGGVYKHRTAPLTAGVDVGRSIDSEFFFSLGAEYWVNKMLGLRFGYYSTGQDLHSESSGDIWGGTTAGLGIRWRKYGFDYALVPKVDLGLVHRLSLSFKM